MRIEKKEWLIFLLLSALSLGVWYKLEYPHFAFFDLSVDKRKAFQVAEKYLRAKGVDPGKFSSAIVFGSDDDFDRYLQHTVGIRGEEDFIARHNYDLFYWKIRFFKELQKEEYSICVSPRSGELESFTHSVDDIAPSQDFGKESSRHKAEEFLKNDCKLDLSKYEFHEEKAKRYEKRTEYSFSWEKRGVYIPWKQGQGGAKLIASATVAGDEIKGFNKADLNLPEKFQRYIENQSILGAYLNSIYFVMYFALLAGSINVVLKKRFDLVPRLTKRWFCYVAGSLALVNLAGVFNSFQYIAMNYPTSVGFNSYLGLSFTNILISIVSTLFILVIPGIAGESLCNEVLPRQKHASFLHYINSSFLNRGMAKSILLGYLVGIIMLGLQTAIFSFGQRFLGVWREWYTMNQFSSTYIPLFSAFAIGANASFNEEIFFRLFGINFAKKYLRSSFLAVLAASLVWGLGHTMYSIFPSWFRVLEIGIIGVFFGFIFLRFGIIPLIVAHYLFDVFWCSAAYMLGRSSHYLFLSSIAVLCLPLALALVAWLADKPEEEREMSIRLNKTQKYNLRILIDSLYLRKSQGHSAGILKEELIRNNWDNYLVDLAIKEVFKEGIP
jgi:hypothetical protein